MNIVMKNTAELHPYERNTKLHDAKQIANVAASIAQYGFVQPIVIDSDGVIVIGHCRYEAALSLELQEVPCVCVDDLTPEQVNALRIVDNKTNESPWDVDFLALELPELDLSMFDFDFNLEADSAARDTDFDDKDNKDGKTSGDDSGPVTEDEAPEVDDVAEPITRPGDIWQLGRHRLTCGDSLDAVHISRLMGGNVADMVFTDPPYGMKKEKDGVANDNLNFADLLKFNAQWIPVSFENLKANGSWYCWGIDEPLMDIYSNILKPMISKDEITFRNLITWKKESGNPTMLYNGACSSNKRSYYTNEKCLFVMCGVQGFNNNADHYDETFEPVRSYMAQQAEKVHLTNKDLLEICGVGMYSHWFTKSQFAIITREHYEELQRYYAGKAFTLDYDDLRTLFNAEEYATLHEDIMAKRAYFNGTESQCIDVWVSDVTGRKEREEAGGHATPKPVALCARAIKSSSRPGEIVLDLFGGSGSTLIAAEQTGRVCYVNELEPKWCDVIIKRWENLTGETAVRLNE